MERFYPSGERSRRIASRGAMSTLIAVNAALGFVVMLSPPDRVRGAAYHPLSALTDGRVWVAGVIMLISAVLVGIRYRWLSIVGLWLSMYSHILWTALFAFTAFRYPHTGLMLVVSCAGFAMLSTVLLTARVIEIRGSSAPIRG